MQRTEVIAIIDGYLLGERKDRKAVFQELATWKPDIQAAVPLVRAIGLIGARAADESLIALRLALANLPIEDEHVRDVRSELQAHAKGDSLARERYFERLR